MQEADALTERIIGAAIAVHRIPGPGLLESIHEEALRIELELRGMAFQRQIEVGVIYKGRTIKGHRLDLLVEGRVVWKSSRFPKCRRLPWRRFCRT